MNLLPQIPGGWMEKSEWKKLAGLVGLMGVCSVVQRERQKKKEQEEAKRFGLERFQNREKGFWEHPFIAYLVENGCVISLSWLAARIPLDSSVADVSLDSPKLSSSVNQFRRGLGMLLRSFVFIEGAIALQDHFLVGRLYSNVPWFSTGRPNVSSLAQLFDWLCCNLPVGVFNSILQTLLLGLVTTREEYKRTLSGKGDVPLKVFPFLLKLAVARVVVDVFFYLGHRTMHQRVLYKVMHARHHEHFKCIVPTNLHFTWPDLFFEGAVPLWMGNMALGALGLFPNGIEMNLLGCYILWFEVASHSGKEIPYATMFPPLAPLMNAFSDVDYQNIKYHETHHNVVKANYGITQWIDKLMGSHRILDQPCDRGEDTSPAPSLEPSNFSLSSQNSQKNDRAVFVVTEKEVELEVVSKENGVSGN